MVFSSMIFLWIFFPIVLLGYLIIQKYSIQYSNIWLLCFSLFFYAWGEPKYIWIMVLSIVINYLSGIFIVKGKHKKFYLVFSIAANLLILGYFKYFFTIATEMERLLGVNWTVKEIILPIGISFYTFQSLSYVIDLYRGEIKLQKNILNLALYVSFFPQLIAGPIVKYRDIATQIEKRDISLNKFCLGIERFIWGLGKKVIIANSVAEMADRIFAVPVETLHTAFIWLGVFLYTLQIYYDFSGYSDMAIGLGKMFGFDFLENFNYPYISESIREFWRRWHISLSTWFKEYVYIPLGGNRGGGYRTYVNLGIVFALTGIWHGASLNFLIWGLYHGLFLIIERAWLGEKLNKSKYKIINHIYVIFVVGIGWAMFRCNSFGEATNLLKNMFKLNVSNSYILNDFISYRGMFIILLGSLLCGWGQCSKLGLKLVKYKDQGYYMVVKYLLQLLVLFLCIMLLVSGTYNPFIYFRF